MTVTGSLQQMALDFGPVSLRFFPQTIKNSIVLGHSMKEVWIPRGPSRTLQGPFKDPSRALQGLEEPFKERERSLWYKPVCQLLEPVWCMCALRIPLGSRLFSGFLAWFRSPSNKSPRSKTSRACARDLPKLTTQIFYVQYVRCDRILMFLSTIVIENMFSMV